MCALYSVHHVNRYTSHTHLLTPAPHPPTRLFRLLYYVFALASMIVGALSTHGLGGRLRHGAVLITRGIQRRRRSSASLPSSPSFTSILGVKQHNDDDDGGGDGDDDGDGDDPTITGRSNSQEQGFDEMAASVPDQLEDAAAAGGDVTDGAIGASPTHSVDRIVDQDIVDQDINRKRTTKHDQKRTTMTSSSTPITSSTTQQGLGWSFFQPFRGGTLFIATQAVAWLFFATCLLLFGWAIYAAVLGVAHCVGCWAVATGLTMFATQVLLGTSLFLFRGGAAATRKVGGVLLLLVVVVMVVVVVVVVCAHRTSFTHHVFLSHGHLTHMYTSHTCTPHCTPHPHHTPHTPHTHRQQQPHATAGSTYGRPSSSSTHHCMCILRLLHVHVHSYHHHWQLQGGLLYMCSG